jgi:hypothetical protein
VFGATIWFGVLGILYLPATDSGDIPGFLVGMQLGLGAMALLFILQVDEISTAAYGATSALESLRLPARWPAPAFVLVAALPGAILLDLGEVQPYALLAASVFIPAFAIVIGRAIWPATRPALVPIAAWVLGFVVYQWVSPAEVGWWRDSLESIISTLGLPFPLAQDAEWLGAAMPAFLIALAVDALPLLAGLYESRRTPRAATS